MTYEEAIKKLHYDPETGAFIWVHKMGRWGRIPAGSRATSADSHGYEYVHVGKVNYRAHRLAWLVMTGVFPTLHIDHINGVRNDNRWCNLREATRSQQQQNHKINVRNTSGYTGVTLTRSGSYAARINVQGKAYCLGSYKTKEEARDAYAKAKFELHDFRRG
jgi:hypothetical protein